MVCQSGPGSHGIQGPIGTSSSPTRRWSESPFELLRRRRRIRRQGRLRRLVRPGARICWNVASPRGCGPRCTKRSRMGTRTGSRTYLDTRMASETSPTAATNSSSLFESKSCRPLPTSSLTGSLRRCPRASISTTLTGQPFQMGRGSASVGNRMLSLMKCTYTASACSAMRGPLIPRAIPTLKRAPQEPSFVCPQVFHEAVPLVE